jgi:hypothetical protein
MEPITIISKKVPPLFLALMLAESFSYFGAELDVHVLARLTGACLGGAATWFWRTDLVRSRRVACLMFGWCAGIGFSPVLDWILVTKVAGLPTQPALTFGSAFFSAVPFVKLFEQLADNPIGLMERITNVVRRRRTKDNPDE